MREQDMHTKIAEGIAENWRALKTTLKNILWRKIEQEKGSTKSVQVLFPERQNIKNKRRNNQREKLSSAAGTYSISFFI